MANINYCYIDAEPGSKFPCIPKSNVDNYLFWLIDEISVSFEAGQSFHALHSFYSQCGVVPSRPDEKPTITGKYAAALTDAITDSYNMVVREASSRRLIREKARETEAKMRKKKETQAEKLERKVRSRNKKQKDLVPDENWKASEEKKAQRLAFLNNFKSG